MSTYDDVHDKYFAGYTAGNGKRYERIAALVMKILDSKQDVIYDRKLRGISDVQHQIDVIVDRNGKRKHVLIECKDHDTSRAKVGLPEIRNFESACRDLEAEEAYFITCNGFTRPAQKYAKHNQIKLLVLRKFRNADWENKIRTVHFDISLFSIINERVEFGIKTQSDIDLLNEMIQYEYSVIPGEIYTPHFSITINGNTMPLQDYLKLLVNEVRSDQVGDYNNEKTFVEAFISYKNFRPISISGISVNFSVVCSNTQSTYTCKRIGELLLCGFNESDMIIFEDDIQQFTIVGDTGQVTKL